jgi:AraC-like DNA-binding protein
MLGTGAWNLKHRAGGILQHHRGVAAADHILRHRTAGGLAAGRRYKFVRDCFASESPPRVSELAARLGLFRSRLHDVFIERYRISPSAYLERRQLEHASNLLRSVIAYRSGFGASTAAFEKPERVHQSVTLPVCHDGMHALPGNGAVKDEILPELLNELH